MDYKDNMIYLYINFKMIIPESEIISVLREFNPWWYGQELGSLPSWSRSAGSEIQQWVASDAKRALLLLGPRQVGKTTLFRQTIRDLLEHGTDPRSILYVTFDSPQLKLAGADQLLRVWKNLWSEPPQSPIYLFLDEIQYVADWQTWIKHQVDFHPEWRIAATGSAIPLSESPESGVGRWKTIKLPTLSFYEYLRLRKVELPTAIPKVESFLELPDWNAGDFAMVSAAAEPLVAHFHEYLMRSGFPEPAQATTVAECQRLLREDAIDKVLKRDMTAIFGVRSILEMEKLFIYLCFHDGGIVNPGTLAKELEGVSKQTVVNFLEIFEASHLLYRLRPHGYGKEVLRGQSKYYLADPAISGSVLLLGERLLEAKEKLGAAVEAAFYKHLFTRYYSQAIAFSYWQSKKDRNKEVDVIGELGDQLIPFEVKYEDARINEGKIPGLRLFCEEKSVDRGYVITRRLDEFGVLPVHSARHGRGRELLPTRVLKIPAPLACLWLSMR